MAVTTTRKFGGKVYTKFDWAETKREADKEVNQQRKQGFFARITKAGDGYVVWLRKSHRGEY